MLLELILAMPVWMIDVFVGSIFVIVGLVVFEYVRVNKERIDDMKDAIERIEAGYEENPWDSQAWINRRIRYKK